MIWAGATVYNDHHKVMLIVLAGIPYSLRPLAALMFFKGQEKKGQGKVAKKGEGKIIVVGKDTVKGGYLVLVPHHSTYLKLQLYSTLTFID